MTQNNRIKIKEAARDIINGPILIIVLSMTTLKLQKKSLNPFFLMKTKQTTQKIQCY